jgi:hypothetical protein
LAPGGAGGEAACGAGLGAAEPPVEAEQAEHVLCRGLAVRVAALWLPEQLLDLTSLPVPQVLLCRGHPPARVGLRAAAPPDETEQAENVLCRGLEFRV